MARFRNPFGLFVAILVTVLLLLFLKSIADILLLFFIAVLFSLYLHAITDFLEHRLDIPRIVGVTAALLMTLVGAGALVALVVPPVLSQTQDLLIALPVLIEGWRAWLIDLALDYPLIGQLVETENIAPVEMTSPLATISLA